MEQYLYLLLNFATVIIPLIFSFYPKANFSRRWRSVLPAIFITAVPFVVWDMIFTAWRIWEFNPRYLTGIHLWNLPLEEVLFFFCIPYACIFTHLAFDHLLKRHPFRRYDRTITYSLLASSLLLCILFFDRLYTVVTFGLLIILLTAGLAAGKTPGRFYFSYSVLLIPFFIVNGILTGTGLDEPVVSYNNAENLRLRLGTIPLEDVFYGFSLILLSIWIQELIERRKKRRNGISDTMG